MKNLQFDALQKVKSNVNIEILEHGHFFGDYNWKHYNISSPFNRLYFVLSGEGFVQNIHEKVILTPGNIYLVPLNSTYNYTCDNLIEKFYIHFKSEFFFGKDIFEVSDKCITLPFEVDTLRKLLYEAGNNDNYNVFKLRVYLSEMIYRLFRETPSNTICQYESALKYYDVFRFVKNECSSKLVPLQISQFLGIPITLLSKNFKADMGYSLKSLITNILVQTAKEKILVTDMKIKEIAFELKFSDEFYFSRFFKKHTGMSPRKYRINNKINI